MQAAALSSAGARGATVARPASRQARSAAPAAPRLSRGRRAPLQPAAAASDPAPVPAQQQQPPVLTWPEDKETARDVFAFAGSLPERLNGRMAMLGFLGIVLAELKQGAPAAEQLASDVGGVALLSVTLTLASIFPKFVSGSSLKDLHASATSDNLKGGEGLGQVLGLFDQSLELWTGRVAMIGVVGLAIVEAVTGRVLF